MLELQQSPRLVELLLCALLVSRSVQFADLQGFICVHLYWNSAPRRAKRVCLTRDAATTAEQSV